MLQLVLEAALIIENYNNYKSYQNKDNQYVTNKPKFDSCIP